MSEDVITEYFGLDLWANDWTVDGVTIRAIFDDAYVEDLNIEGTAPQIEVPKVTADAIAVVAGHVAIGPEGTFTVRGIQPTGDGGVTLLILEA